MAHAALPGSSLESSAACQKVAFVCPRATQVANQCHELRFLIASPKALIGEDSGSEGFGIETILADSARHRLTAPNQKSRTRIWETFSHDRVRQLLLLFQWRDTKNFFFHIFRKKFTVHRLEIQWIYNTNLHDVDVIYRTLVSLCTSALPCTEGTIFLPNFQHHTDKAQAHEWLHNI